MSFKSYDIAGPGTQREAVRLLYISKFHGVSELHAAPHTHACTEMYYCVQGQGQFDVGGRLQAVGPDDLMIINPLIPHAEKSLADDPLEYIVLGLEGVEVLFEQENNGCVLISCADLQQDVQNLLHMLLREVDGHSDGCEAVCQNLLEVLLVFLVRAASLTLRPAAERAGNKECATAKRYLDEHYTESISLDQLAAVTRINKYYLSHAFRKEYHTSPINYLIRKRITESKALLANTDYSLAQISGMLGFSSASYFSQSFRKMEGISPTEFRKTARRSPG